MSRAVSAEQSLHLQPETNLKYSQCHPSNRQRRLVHEAHSAHEQVAVAGLKDGIGCILSWFLVAGEVIALLRQLYSCPEPAQPKVCSIVVLYCRFHFNY